MSAYFKAFLANPEPFLKELAKSNHDAQQFLKEVPEEYKMLFAKPKKDVATKVLPDYKDITGMELTAWYNPRVDKRSSNININCSVFTDTTINFSDPAWDAMSIMVTKRGFKDWKKRQIKDKTAISDEQSLDTLEQCLEVYTHAGYAYIKGYGTSSSKVIICANIEHKTITDCIVYFHDYHIKPSKFIYKERYGSFNHENIFAKYRYSKKPKGDWVTTDQWISNVISLKNETNNT